MTGSVVAQIGSAIPSTPLELIASSDPVTKVILMLLAVLSLVSWTIMLAKWREFAKVRKQSAVFVEAFSHAHGMDEVAQTLRRAGSHPFAHVFERAERFLHEVQPAMAGTGDRGPRFSASQVEALRLVLDAQTEAERDTLSRYVPWLATIGSASPLIGLLGTVLGIIQSFIGIATKGSGNVGSVAPGVAAALTATAAALAVAIPAVFGYNIFANRLNRFEGQLEGFGSELIALLVREGRI